MDFHEYDYDHKSKKPKLDDENGASRRHRDRSDRHRSERHRSKGRHDDEREHKRSSRDKKSRDRERRDREKDKEREREREKRRRSRSHSRIEGERERDREKERELEARQMSTSTSILSPNHENNRSMVCLDIQDLFVKVLAICYPKLKENAILESLKGEARKTLGDYAFLGVVDICDQLRKDDPLLFTRVGPSDVAQKIKKAFESQKFEMIRTLFLNDAGILTFSLEGRWMAQDQDDVYTDLATLWHGVTIQEADVMIYITPHRLREYIEQCHNAAANEGWLPDGWKDIGTLTCCGFRTFGGEQQELHDLWCRLKEINNPSFKRIQKLCSDAWYTLEAFFECAFKFTCLKSHRLADTIFKFEHIVDEKENTFLSLLVTQARIRSLIRHWPAKNSPGENLFNLNFMEGACGSLAPHGVCDYVNKLAKLFSYAFPHTRLNVYDRHENMLGLCKATEVVMDKCFHLLGIGGPSSNDWTQEFISFYNRKVARPIDHDIIPSSVARHEYPESRLEIFSMTVTVKHPFDHGSIFGTISVVDTCRLAKGVWMSLDPNDDVHISYFNRKWHDPVHLRNGIVIPLGNPSSLHSIPLSSSLEIHCLMKATSEDNDQTYLLSNGKGTVDPAELMEFWNGESNTMCGTIKFDREDGNIWLDYIAIKNAIDTKMQLIFNPVRAVRLRGNITASYGEDVIGDRGFLGQYVALIFEADQSKCIEYQEEPQLLPLCKSTLAVPANGCIRMRAEIEDVDTNKCIVDTKDFWDSGSSEDIWDIECVGSLKFKLNWVR